MAFEKDLETIRFGAYGPDARDNFDEWAGHSPNHRLRRAESHFSAEASFWQLDRLIMTEQRLDPFIGERPAEHALAVPTNQVTFIVLFEGGMTYRPDDGVQYCEAGDVVLLDFQRTYSFITERQLSATISMDRRILEDDVGPLQIHGRMPRTAETHMLADFARMLTLRLPDLSMSSAIPSAMILRRLITLALLRGHPQTSSLKNDSARARAIAFIESLPPGTLDVSAMSEALNCTRPTLYRLFKSDGGVLSYDRRRRLRLLHRSLCEEPATVSLSDLGARFGFFDAANLSRQFKAEFGLSMSQVRLHLLPRFRSRGSVGRYREAISRFE